MDSEPSPEEEKACGKPERSLWAAYCGPDFHSAHLLSGLEGQLHTAIFLSADRVIRAIGLRVGSHGLRFPPTSRSDTSIAPGVAQSQQLSAPRCKGNRSLRHTV